MYDLDSITMTDLELRAGLLQHIIKTNPYDPRIHRPIRQLRVLETEIKKRRMKMKYIDMTAEELEQEREAIQAQIEGLTEMFVEAGKILSEKREAGEIKGEIESLEKKISELETKLNSKDQVVSLQTLSLKALFNKIVGR